MKPSIRRYDHHKKSVSFTELLLHWEQTHHAGDGQEERLTRCHLYCGCRLWTLARCSLPTDRLGKWILRLLLASLCARTSICPTLKDWQNGRKKSERKRMNFLWNAWIELQEAPFLFINGIEGFMPHKVTPGINSIKWTNSHCVPLGLGSNANALINTFFRGFHSSPLCSAVLWSTVAVCNVVYITP